MAVLNGLGRSLKAVRRRLTRRLGRRPEDLVDLMVDSGALVAAADGDPRAPAITAEEAAAVLRAARQLADLEGLRLRRVVRRFDETRDQLRRSPAARGQILERCTRLRDKPKAAALVLQVAEAVAAVDGVVSPREREELSRLAVAVGLGRPAADEQP